jgi:hypothetical protein
MSFDEGRLSGRLSRSVAATVARGADLSDVREGLALEGS